MRVFSEKYRKLFLLQNFQDQMQQRSRTFCRCLSAGCVAVSGSRCPGWIRSLPAERSVSRVAGCLQCGGIDACRQRYRAARAKIRNRLRLSEVQRWVQHLCIHPGFPVKDRIILEIIESVIEKGSRICINLSSVGSKRDAYKPFAIPLGVSDQRV